MKLDDLLRELPPRPAPADLEIRVLRELARRAALPWWQRGFAHWPMTARVLLGVVCGVIVGITVWSGPWAKVTAAIAANSGPAVFLTQHATASLAALDGLAAVVGRLIPMSWLYGATALAALLYAALFGLGAAAYRTLYLRPSTAGELQ